MKGPCPVCGQVHADNFHDAPKPWRARVVSVELADSPNNPTAQLLEALVAPKIGGDKLLTGPIYTVEFLRHGAPAGRMRLQRSSAEDLFRSLGLEPESWHAAVRESIAADLGGFTSAKRAELEARVLDLERRERADKATIYKLDAEVRDRTRERDAKTAELVSWEALASE